MQFYSSNPTITNCTIDGSGQSAASNGIRFAEISSGSVTNSTIKNLSAGNGIVIEGGSTPFISNNTIRDNYYYEIVFPNNGVSTPVKIYQNTLLDDRIPAYSGIVLNGASALFFGNTVSGHTAGLLFENGSLVRGWDPAEQWWNTLVGANTITSNDYGIIGYSDGDCFLGDYAWDDGLGATRYFGGCNAVHSNSIWNVLANGTGTTLTVRGNYWGTSTPLNTMNVPGPAKLYYTPFHSTPAMDCSYNGARILAGADDPFANSPTKSELPQFDLLRSQWTQGRFSDAVSTAEAMALQGSDLSVRRLGLTGLFRSISESRDPSLLAALEPGRFDDAGLRLAAKRLLGLILVDWKRSDEALSLLQSVVSEAPESEDARLALMTIASLSGHDRKYLSASQAAALVLRANHADRELDAFLAALSLDLPGQESIPASETPTSRSDAEPNVSAQPNPFNPATLVSLELYEPAHVELRVFDVIGREVEQLYGGSLEAGIHRLRWEAGSRPSGTYFCRVVITQEGKEAVRKTLKLILAR